MKTHILTTTIALLTSAAFAAETVQKNESSASASVVNGKATVTIDVNGKKETREIDLGNGREIQIITSSEGGGASGSATAGGSVKVAAPKIVTWLGVAPDEISEEVRAQLPLEAGTGLVVRNVMAESPAMKAGLQKNDVLLKIDDQLLTNPAQLRTLIAAKKDGDTVKITYLRRGQQAVVEARLASHEDQPVLNLTNASDWLGRLELGKLFGFQSKAVIVDKDGNVIGNKAPDMRETVEKIAKTLRGLGVDEKSIDDATRALTETTNAIRDAVKDASVAKDEVQKGSGDIAKALEQVRDAIEKVRKQTEDAVRKDRENRREEKQSLEK